MKDSTIDHLTQLTAYEAARKICQREITSEALVKHCLDLIGMRENEIFAWAHLNPQEALAQACAADHAIQRGAPTGPLHGVPVAIKDIIDTTDFPTEHGCPIFLGNQPEMDADVVTNLRRSGAIILGKTVTTELALLTPALTRNPVNAEHSPGGSSAGSAAAVASFMVPAALGTQTAGSILRPASYCGVVGFKPTLGLVPRRGVLMQSHTLDTVGVLTRSIRDAALLTYAMMEETAVQQARQSVRNELFEFLESNFSEKQQSFAFVKTPVWDQG